MHVFMHVLRPADVTRERSKQCARDTVTACKILSAVFLFFLLIRDEPLLTEPRDQHAQQTKVDQ